MIACGSYKLCCPTQNPNTDCNLHRTLEKPKNVESWKPRQSALCTSTNVNKWNTRIYTFNLTFALVQNRAENASQLKRQLEKAAKVFLTECQTELWLFRKTLVSMLITSLNSCVQTNIGHTCLVYVNNNKTRHYSEKWANGWAEFNALSNTIYVIWRGIHPRKWPILCRVWR